MDVYLVNNIAFLGAVEFRKVCELHGYGRCAWAHSRPSLPWYSLIHLNA